jgi:hypothetical protein
MLIHPCVHGTFITPQLAAPGWVLIAAQVATSNLLQLLLQPLHCVSVRRSAIKNIVKAAFGGHRFKGSPHLQNVQQASQLQGSGRVMSIRLPLQA